MAKIRIEDLPKGMTIGADELKRIRGGALNAYLRLSGGTVDHKLTETLGFKVECGALDYGKIEFGGTTDVKL